MPPHIDRKLWCPFITRDTSPPCVGGGTRILIIEDDYTPSPQLPPSYEGSEPVDAQGVNPGMHPHGSHPGSEGRPVVHEIQLAGPQAADTNHSGSPVHDANQSEVSVVRELMARVDELLQHTRGLPAGATTAWGGTIRFGRVLIEPSTQTVLREGQPVRVTHTEFRLLLALMRRRGAIASRPELLREVWGIDSAVSPRAVDTHIARLRRKLEEDPANPRHILTALAWGYRFRP
jgi:hypothetical protein